MTDTQPGACGHLLPSGVRFCPECGSPARPAVPAPVTPPVHQPGPAPTPQVEWAQPAAPGARPLRNGRVVLVAALVLVLLGGGGLAAYSLLGGGGGHVTYNGVEIPLAEAVTSEPEREWSWDSDDGVSSVATVGDDVVVSTGSGELVRLDEEGREVWSVDGATGSTNLTVLPGHEDLVIGSDYEAEEIRAFSVEDGSELWSVDSAWVRSPLADGLLFANEDGVGVVDVDGEELWTAEDVQGVAAAGESVYVVAGDRLSRRAATSGDEDWSIEVDVEDDEYSSVSVAANQEMVVVADTEVVAYDSGDGDRLWTAEAGPDGAEVSPYSDSEVVVSPWDWSSEDPESSLVVYDTEGEVAELETDADDGYHFLLPVHSGGDFVLDIGSGTVYGDDHEVVGEHDGQLAPADGGLYVVELLGTVEEYDEGYEDEYEDSAPGEADVSFLDYDGAEPRWAITVDYEGYLDLTTLDGGLVLFDDGEVAAYR